MKHAMLLMLATTLLVSCIPSSSAQEAAPTHCVFLPLASKQLRSTATPIARPTLQPMYELLSGDFENGSDGSRTEYASIPLMGRELVITYLQFVGIEYIEEYGSWLGWLGDRGRLDPPPWECVTAIKQTVTVLPRTVLCFEYLIYSEDLQDEGGDVVELLFDDAVLASWDVIRSNSDFSLSDWHEVCIDTNSWWGEVVVLQFKMVSTFAWQGDFYIDNIEFRQSEVLD